ncbi:unnamed protein product, partial [Darwinula stevensoni]
MLRLKMSMSHLPGTPTCPREMTANTRRKGREKLNNKENRNIQPSLPPSLASADSRSQMTYLNEDSNTG